MTLRISTLLPVGLFVVMGIVLAVGVNRDPKGLPSTLINVFGSWCVSCRYEHPLLLRVSKDTRFKLFGIDWKDGPDEAKQYLAQNGDPYAQIGADVSGRTAIDHGVSGAPETFAVDTQGRVQLRIPGPLTPEIWDKEIEPLIKEAQQTP